MTVATPTDIALSTGDSANPARPVYLDCNATTPIDPRVQAEVLKYMVEEFGNAGSRTHNYGQVAKERVTRARQEVATVVGSQPDEVTFTSGATESNNIAILGLAAHGEQTGRRHIISTQIEHKAVLEPMATLADRGFEVTLLPPGADGRVEADLVRQALRPDTLLVSVMGVNNETGVIQPVKEITDAIAEHDTYFHVDGAQAFGKLISLLRNPRIDLLSISGHKIHGPKGVGALITRRRNYRRPPLQPLMYGGCQERGLRPGTLPVALVAGFGTAATAALTGHEERSKTCQRYRARVLDAFLALGADINGDINQTLPNTLNLSIPGLDSEAVMLALKEMIALSNGSACTSQNYKPSHVLSAMGLSEERIQGALRISWCHLSEEPDWERVQAKVKDLM